MNSLSRMEEVVVGGNILKAKALVLFTGMGGFGCGARTLIATGAHPIFGIGAGIRTQFFLNLLNHIFLILKRG